jgi:hypothetical protein
MSFMDNVKTGTTYRGAGFAIWLRLCKASSFSISDIVS